MSLKKDYLNQQDYQGLPLPRLVLDMIASYEGSVDSSFLDPSHPCMEDHLPCFLEMPPDSETPSETNLSKLILLNQKNEKVISLFREQIARQEKFITQITRKSGEAAQEIFSQISADYYSAFDELNHAICNLAVRLCNIQNDSVLTTKDRTEIFSFVNNLSVVRPSLKTMFLLIVEKQVSIPIRSREMLMQLIFMAYNNRQYKDINSYLKILETFEPGNPVEFEVKFPQIALQILVKEAIPTLFACLEAPNLKEQASHGFKLCHILMSMLIRCNSPIYRPADFLEEERVFNQGRLAPEAQRAFLCHHEGQEELRLEIERICGVTDPATITVGNVSHLPHAFHLLNIPIEIPTKGNRGLIQHSHEIQWSVIQGLMAVKNGAQWIGSFFTKQAVSPQDRLTDTAAALLAPSRKPFRVQTLVSLREACNAYLTMPIFEGMPFNPALYLRQIIYVINGIRSLA